MPKVINAILPIQNLVFNFILQQRWHITLTFSIIFPGYSVYFILSTSPIINSHWQNIIRWDLLPYMITSELFKKPTLFPFNLSLISISIILQMNASSA